MCIQIYTFSIVQDCVGVETISEKKKAKEAQTEERKGEEEGGLNFSTKG